MCLQWNSLLHCLLTLLSTQSYCFHHSNYTHRSSWPNQGCIYLHKTILLTKEVVLSMMRIWYRNWGRHWGYLLQWGHRCMRRMCHCWPNIQHLLGTRWIKDEIVCAMSMDFRLVSHLLCIELLLPKNMDLSIAKNLTNCISTYHWWTTWSTIQP